MAAKIHKTDLETIIQMIKIHALDFLKEYSPRNEPKVNPEIGENPPNMERQRVLLGQASQLVSFILDKAGDKEDFKDAVFYAFAIMDAHKHNLSVVQLMEKYHIPQLYRKYGPATDLNDRKIASLLKKIERYHESEKEAANDQSKL